jgi:hypothetical protein
MKNTFVIDEDVFLFAQKGEDDKGNLDVTAIKLVLDIFYNCHSIVIDDILWGKYCHKMAALQKNSKLLGVNILGLIRQGFSNPNKGKWIQNVRTIDCESTIPEDDRYLVRLAVSAGAILVTDDDPLRDSVQKSCLSKRYKLMVLPPIEAINYASPEHVGQA